MKIMINHAKGALVGCRAVLSAAAWSIPVPLMADPGVASDGDCWVNLDCNRASRVAERPERPTGPDLSGWTRLVVAQPVASTSAAAPPARIEEPLLGSPLILLSGACYELPSDRSSAADQGQGAPARLCIQPFYMSVHEVTFDAFDRFVEATGREPPDDEGWGRGQRPVINVNVYDASAFAKWLSRRTGVRHRLPTETEWEYAARAGTVTAYPWGDAIGSGLANCSGCGSRWDDEQTAPVGSFAPNAWGLHDMVGNVAEWTCSMRDPEPVASFTDCDSLYQTRRRTYRNGAWSDPPDRLGSGFRDWNAAMRRTDDVGFRLVRECTDCERLSVPQSPRIVLENGR
jgi:formylglycine-generating enzyme required for sulfatase activity